MRASGRPAPSPESRAWGLDPEVIFLNHGSFGACPTRVLDAQAKFRRQMEAEPVRFLVRELPELWDAARVATAAAMGTAPGNLAFVTNATSGVNTVLRSLHFEPGDEILVLDQGYPACTNAAFFVAERAGATVRTVALPWPIPDGPDGEAAVANIISAIMAGVTPKTRLALLDHIVSATGVVLPMAKLVAALDAKGVDTLVDGAHAPGQVPLSLDALGAAYYTGNAHKWLCAPKGTAILVVRPDRQAGIRPLTISHGARGPLSPGQTRFLAEMDWTGTRDPTGVLTLPTCLDVLSGFDGSCRTGSQQAGLNAHMAHNRAMALRARRVLSAALDVAPPVPESMTAALVAMPIPESLGPESNTPVPAMATDPLQALLMARHGIEIPIFPWAGGRLIRLSAQRYISDAWVDHLAGALQDLRAGR